MERLDYTIIAEYPKDNFIEALLSIKGLPSSLRICFQVTDFKNRYEIIAMHEIRLGLAMLNIPKYTTIAVQESVIRYTEYCLIKGWEYADPVLFELYLYEEGSVDYYFSYHGDLDFESINIKENKNGEIVIS